MIIHTQKWWAVLYCGQRTGHDKAGPLHQSIKLFSGSSPCCHLPSRKLHKKLQQTSPGHKKSSVMSCTIKKTQKPTLTLLVHSLGPVIKPLQSTFKVNPQIFVTVRHPDVQTMDVHWYDRCWFSPEVNHHLCCLTGVNVQVIYNHFKLEVE